MNLKKFLPTKFVLLLIVITLLMPNGLLNARSVVAKTRPVSPQDDSGSSEADFKSSEFDGHNIYHPFQREKESRAKWEIDVNFVGVDIDAKWIIHIEQKQRDEKWILTDEYIMHLECEKQGNVEIENDVAQFNPATRDHISCDIPSYRAAVKQLLDMNLDIHCDCIDPWLSAVVHTTPNQQREYPVISLNPVGNSAAVFDATIRREGHTQAYFEMMMSRWDYPETSNAFNISQPQTLWSGINLNRFIETLNERHSRYPDIWTALWVSTNLDAYLNGLNSRSGNIWFSWVKDLASQQSIADAQRTIMYTDEMTLYIGYNPATKKYFRGQMTNIGVDPGCAGLGGRRFPP